MSPTTLGYQATPSQDGLAGSGTRVIVRVTGAPGAVQLMVPTLVNTSGGSGGVLRLITSDLSGAGAFATMGAASTQVAMTVDPSGVSYATYEVLKADPAALETVTIPVTPVYPAGGNWIIGNVTAGLARFDATPGASLIANVPRFAA